MICEKNRRLLANYNVAVSEWAEAAQRLKGQAGIDLNCYTRLKKVVDEARSKTELAKDAYVTHVELHGCYSTSQPRRARRGSSGEVQKPKPPARGVGGRHEEQEVVYSALYPAKTLASAAPPPSLLRGSKPSTLYEFEMISRSSLEE